MVVTDGARVRTTPDESGRTEVGKRLRLIRMRALAKSMQMLDRASLEREIAEHTGRRENPEQ